MSGKHVTLNVCGKNIEECGVLVDICTVLPYEYVKRSHNNELLRMLKKRIREGYNPQPEVIVCTYQSSNYAKLVESCLIEKYGRKDLNKGTLFNHTDGGEGGSAPANIRWNKPGARERARVIQRARRAKPNAPTNREDMKTWWAKPENKELHKERMNSPEVSKKCGANKAKPCTVDGGVTVFPSRKALVAVHGRYKKGAGSPNFCWVVDGILIPRKH